MLSEALLGILSAWRPCFSRARTFERAVAMAFGLLCGIGRATTSRAIQALGRQGRDWTGDYRLSSKAPWQSEDLFDAVLKESLSHIDSDWVVSAYDDTRLKKTGKNIRGAQYYRDPLSPPFHPNLMYGLRFLQCSLMLPLHKTQERRARAIPVSFELAPCAKKPGKKASPEQIAEYKKARKIQNLSVSFVENLARLRRRLDASGAQVRLSLVSVDGSFCNRRCLARILERTAILARARKDAKLCMPAPKGGRKKYGQDKFTPAQILADEKIPFEKAGVVFGGTERELRFKRVEGVLWQSGTKTRLLTLLVLAPTGYRNHQHGRMLYRDPAFLICTSTGLDPVRLIQAYVDRWQIEVNHQEEKDILGVGQAQVWSEFAIPRQPALAVAAYSLLMLAALKAFGPGRGKAYPELPKWRKQQRRPSIRDMIALLRSEFADPQSAVSKRVKPPEGLYNLVATAAA